LEYSHNCKAQIDIGQLKVHAAARAVDVEVGQSQARTHSASDPPICVVHLDEDELSKELSTNVLTADLELPQKLSSGSLMMATPSAFRLAVEACRPTKVCALMSSIACPHNLQSSVIRTRPLSQKKRFLSSTRPFASADITAGFPEPNVYEHKLLLHDADTPKTSTIAERSDRPQVCIDNGKPLPPNVLATLRVPMKHRPQYGLPVANIQLRSYSVRNLEFFCDFCLRAAFYLKLPASGPVPLPRWRESWTTLRSPFVHKKSQENFERITYRRLITVMDGHAETVERWLAFVRKYQFYGVGMKANVWEFSSLDVGAKMDQTYKTQVERELSDKLKDFGFSKTVAEKTSLDRLLRRMGNRQVGMPMSEVRERSLTAEEKAYNQGFEVKADKTP
jgi:small subunit ribosomal protein S10